VITAYKATYGRDLIADLKSELSGNFATLVLAAMQTPGEFDATCLRQVSHRGGLLVAGGRWFSWVGCLFWCRP
jgi:hypothetical protein